jgi:hypothetical protein
MRSLKTSLIAVGAALAIIGGARVDASAVQQLPSTDHGNAQLVALQPQLPRCRSAGPKSGAFCWNPPAAPNGQGSSPTNRPPQPNGSPTRPLSSQS